MHPVARLGLVALFFGTCLASSCAGPSRRGVEVPKPTADELRRELDRTPSFGYTSELDTALEQCRTLARLQSIPWTRRLLDRLEWHDRNREASTRLLAALEAEIAALDGDTAHFAEASALHAHDALAGLHVAAGSPQAAIDAMRAFHRRWPSFTSTLRILDLHITSSVPMGDPVEFCARNRVHAEDADSIASLIFACAQVGDLSGVGRDLPWATSADWEAAGRWYAARVRKNVCRASYVLIRNRCREDVDVEYSDKRMWGSISLYPGASRTHSFCNGELLSLRDSSGALRSMIWIEAPIEVVDVEPGCDQLTGRG